MIILDTHTWIWWESEYPTAITDSQQEAIRRELRPGGVIGISAITCWEIAMLVEGRRLDLHGRDAPSWLRTSLTYPNVQLIPITPEIAVRAYTLPEPFHRDPADRILVATALELSCPLLTSDRRIIEYPHVTTI